MGMTSGAAAFGGDTVDWVFVGDAAADNPEISEYIVLKAPWVLLKLNVCSNCCIKCSFIDLDALPVKFGFSGCISSFVFCTAFCVIFLNVSICTSFNTSSSFSAAAAGGCCCTGAALAGCDVCELPPLNLSSSWFIGSEKSMTCCWGGFETMYALACVVSSAAGEGE